MGGARSGQPEDRGRFAQLFCPRCATVTIQACSRIRPGVPRDGGRWIVATRTRGQLPPINCCRAARLMCSSCKRRIFIPDRIRAAERTALANGRNPVFTHAHALPTSHLGSGGCGMLRRRGAAIRDTTKEYISSQHAHRICISWVDGVVRGGMHFVSVYLRTSEGLTPANMAILEELAVALRALKGPLVVEADWNVPPDTMAAARWPEMVGGKIFPTKLPTCNDETYDFFVVHQSLAHAVVGVQRLEDSAFPPHWATRLFLKGDAKRYALRRLCKPPLVKGVLPQGPQMQPPSYQEVHHLAATAEGAEQAMVQWYRNARAEWSALTGEELHHGAPKFRWLPAAGVVAKPWAGTTALSVMWRTLASRADETKRFLEMGVNTLRPSQARLLAQHPASAPAAAGRLCRTQRAEVEPLVRAWDASLHAAANWNTPVWALSLATVARAKAKKLEEATQRSRALEWRVAIGATGVVKNASRAPTRFAYRWVKGLAGWQQSPVGDALANEAVPDVGHDGEVEENLDEIYVGNPAEDLVKGKSLIPLSDQATVEAEADKWAALWQEGEHYAASEWSFARPALQILAPWAIRMAASTFPVGTGLGVDNIAPRAVLRLSDDALWALAALFACFEMAGSWTAALDLVVIVLLPKSDGVVQTRRVVPDHHTLMDARSCWHRLCLGVPQRAAQPVRWSRDGSAAGGMASSLCGRACGPSAPRPCASPP